MKIYLSFEFNSFKDLILQIFDKIIEISDSEKINRSELNCLLFWVQSKNGLLNSDIIKLDFDRSQKKININHNRFEKVPSNLFLSGIYRFKKRGRIIYIGKSERIYKRIADHKFIFDEIDFINIHSKQLLYIEQQMIEKYKPRFNKR